MYSKEEVQKWRDYVAGLVNGLLPIPENVIESTIHNNGFTGCDVREVAMAHIKATLKVVLQEYKGECAGLIVDIFKLVYNVGNFEIQ